MSYEGKQKAKTTERYDTSQLTDAGRGHLVHRDYAAHFFRWGWAKRFVKLGSRVLDVGCGRDTPLAKVLRGAMKKVPGYYLGVDYQKVDAPAGNFWVETLGEFDFVERWREIADAAGDELFDVACCFEAIEHMAREDGLRLLDGLRALLAPTGTLLLSTPVFNGRLAAAHIHEWTVPELADALAGAGLRVLRRHGTFASRADIDAAATPADRATLDRLREYYDDDVAACFLAPMYPDASRNCAWVCVRA